MAEQEQEERRRLGHVLYLSAGVGVIVGWDMLNTAVTLGPIKALLVFAVFVIVARRIRARGASR